MRSSRNKRSDEQRAEFLKLPPLERIRLMHNLFLEIISLRARGEGVTEQEIYLGDDPRHHGRRRGRIVW